jgi:hypothetical protein
MTNISDIQKDYGWRCAFNEADGGYRYSDGTDSPIINNITEVIAAVEGDNDGPDWLMLGKLNDGRYFKLVAGCDYTGWD